MQIISFSWFSLCFYINLTNGFSSKRIQKTRVPVKTRKVTCLSSQWGSEKINYSRDWCLMNSQPVFLFLTYFLTQLITAILSKGCEPYNFEPCNSLKLSFTNIWGLRSNFVECDSFLESNSPDILALCETNLDDSIERLSSFNLKRFYYSYAWSCSLCERRTSL